MARILINCPRTGKPVLTGMVMDEKVFQTSTVEGNVIAPCPHCGASHRWNKDQAYLEGRPKPSQGNPPGSQ